MKFTLNIQSSEQLANICGSYDKNIENIGANLGVNISNKGADFNIKGENSAIAVSVLQDLLTVYENKAIDFGDIDLCIKSLNSPNGEIKSVTIKTSRKHIHIRSTNQQNYVNAIVENDAVFAVGPAGTGKTYLAVARAVEALESSDVKRIVLVRPAVEAGEKLGFLPGDLSEKVDPYLRPIYDALYEFIGFEKVNKLIEQRVIEVAPLAFMRGRTLDNAFVILDEAQNTSHSQMKMFLTRMGSNAKFMITGDPGQIDLPKKSNSGLISILSILKNIKDIGIVELNEHDIARHRLVKHIINAYSKLEG